MVLRPPTGHCTPHAAVAACSSLVFRHVNGERLGPPARRAHRSRRSLCVPGAPSFPSGYARSARLTPTAPLDMPATFPLAHTPRDPRRAGGRRQYVCAHRTPALGGPHFRRHCPSLKGKRSDRTNATGGVCDRPAGEVPRAHRVNNRNDGGRMYSVVNMK